MCSMYWNLTTDLTCPRCGVVEKDAVLQTHFMGDAGSCVHWYRLGEPVAELVGMARALMEGQGGRDFLAYCEACGHYSDWGASIRDGAVVEVWPLPPRTAA